MDTQSDSKKVGAPDNARIPENVLRILSYDLSDEAFRKSRRTIAKPIEIQKPNVELFDDPTHNGQYWGGNQ